MHCAVKQVAQKSFLDNKKIMKEFFICLEGGGSTNIWKIPYVLSFFFFESFPNLFDLDQPTEMFYPISES